MRSLLFSIPMCAMALVFSGCGGSDETQSPGTDSGGTDTGASDSAQGDSTSDSTADSTTDSGTDTAGDSPVDSAGDSGSGDTKGDVVGDAGACGDKTCTSSEICVRTYTTGGACMLCGDGGACPAGRHCEGSCCVPDVVSYYYQCKPTPSGCGPTATCSSCGSSVCTGGCPCESVSGGVVTCHCLAP